jgi:predicted nucleic acid-binding protein
VKLYLDNSFLNRFFDDPSIGANKLEREVLLRILSQVHTSQIQLVDSSVIAFENARNPFPERKQFVEQVMKTASMFQSYTATAHERAEQLVSERRFSLYDARHISVAETAQVDFFLTCDYDLIKKYQGTMNVMTPATFATYYDQYHEKHSSATVPACGSLRRAPGETRS